MPERRELQSPNSNAILDKAKILGERKKNAGVYHKNNEIIKVGCHPESYILLYLFCIIPE